MIELKIPSMSCGHCVSTITRAIQQTDPAAVVDIDLASRQVRVQSLAERNVIVAAIVEAGYEPEAAA